MLVEDAALSFLHFTFLLILVGALSAEAFILRLPVDARVARLLLRIDVFYALSAIGLILAGVARVAWGAKGADFYAAQPFFWAKIGAFALIGVISIWPTRAFIRWNKAAGADARFFPQASEAKRVRALVVAELHVLALVVLFAVLMARGFGR